MQKTEKQLPEFINLDTAFEKLLPNEAAYIKNIEAGINGNPENGDGSNNPTGEGQTVLSLTPTRSNIRVPGVLLPEGYNKNIGSFESITTQENYQFNFNINGNHGIYVLDGNTGIWSKVIEDPQLGFTDDQEAFVAEHRVRLRIINDAAGNIVAKFLLITDGNSWQKWINVIAAQQTNGYDAALFPYFTLMQPHFDRRELLEWAARPIMYNPTVVPLPNMPADMGKVNRLVDQAFQFAASVNYTDGRPTPLSPYSLPLIIKSEDFENNPDNLSKKALLTIYAGSCMVESIDIYVRSTVSPAPGAAASTIGWGTWSKYIRLYKYANSQTSSGNVLSTPYWLRTNPWANNSYDPIQNTIQFVFDNSLQAEIADNINYTPRLQNDIPQISKALTDVGDAELLGDNRYGYNNLSGDAIQKISVDVVEKSTTDCVVPLRNVTLYAYIGRCGDDFVYYSQVGYFVGQDTTVRFGSLGTDGVATLATFLKSESQTFALDFADKKALRVYLKGTPYYADGVWIQVNSDNSKITLDGPLDFGNNDTLEYVQNVFKSQGYFACQFDLKIPAGRYIATLGRHNVSSSGDYRNTSTYIEGIANSRIKTLNSGVVISIKPNAITTYSKELEIDCTLSDIDVWGNGNDLFYVYCPYITHRGNGAFRFIEGYFQESPSSPLGVEMFPYLLTQITDDWGRFTDKNGFYFAYTKANSAGVANIQMICKLNCTYPTTFIIPTSQGGSGWRPNGIAYLSDHNSGVVGDCNRIIYTGKITNLDGTIGYSNIGISIKDGATTYTQSDGTFELIIHNGQNTLRSSNVYVNAGGNFLITIADCGSIPLFHFDETFTPCVNCQKRTYPFQLILSVNAQGGTQFSLKENGTYAIGGALADLAGRLTFVNVLDNKRVPSFLERNDILPTFFQLIIGGSLEFPKDLAWFAPYVTNQLGILGYIQWVADSIVYVDANGNVVSDQSGAVFMSINITSLYNANIGRNFTLLTNYQFVNGDRLRILDNGDGQLLSVAQFGEPIDVQILGTNYNQAAMAAGIIPNSSPTPIINNNISNNVTTNVTAASGNATVVTKQTTDNATSVTLYVKYDARFNSLIKDTGLWIEIYTPSQTVQEVPFNELTWYPVVNGEIAVFEGFSNGRPVYSYPKTIDIDFWDTYLFSRNINIPGVGNQFFSHPFESPNISDAFGYHITSGGRQSAKNDDAKQLWYPADVIRSDNLTSNGVVNGLGFFRSSNRKDFSQNQWGGIQAMITQRSIIFILCENDWFTVNFNFHYTYPNAQGVMIVNLDENISTPAQKIGDNFGMEEEDNATFGVFDKYIWWYDRKNAALVFSDYQSASDVTDLTDQSGRKYGIKSYLTKKTEFITNWNLMHDNDSRFDVISGVDMVRRNVHLCFRPRRQNTNDLSSYVNQRRNLQLNYQETVVYNMDTKRFTRFAGFCPESFGKIRGNATGVEFLSFAAGITYTHNRGNTSFGNFYGQQTESILMPVFNSKDNDFVKILESISFDCNINFLIDLIYTEEPYSYSYLPTNLIKNRENMFYGGVLRDMGGYPNPDPKQLFRSLLLDGKRLFSTHFICRFVSDPATIGQFFQLLQLYYLYTYSANNKK